MFGLLQVGLIYPEDGQRKCLSTSIIVPCYHGHARHLRELLCVFEKQAVLPDEVVISLSEFEKVEPNIIDDLQKELWAFPLKLICSKRQYFAGQNRNIACSYATGDLFITQDADDLVHPQRVEIIKYFFEHYNIDFLMHQFSLEHQINSDLFMKKQYELGSVEFFNPRDFSHAWNVGYVTNGNIAMRRNVFSKCKWPSDRKGQDVKFNQKVFRHFKKRLVIKASIYLYRINLTSDGGNGKDRHDIKRSQRTNKQFPITIVYYD
jgi:glycosyltransferase involved in cell wall biosynthesis